MQFSTYKILLLITTIGWIFLNLFNELQVFWWFRRVHCHGQNIFIQYSNFVHITPLNEDVLIYMCFQCACTFDENPFSMHFSSISSRLTMQTSELILECFVYSDTHGRIFYFSHSHVRYRATYIVSKSRMLDTHIHKAFWHADRNIKYSINIQITCHI